MSWNVAVAAMYATHKSKAKVKACTELKMNRRKRVLGVRE